MKIEITLNQAIAKVVEQLSGVANGTAVQTACSTAEKMRRQKCAEHILHLLANASIEDQIEIIRKHENEMINMEIGRAGISANWAHIAVMINGGQKYFQTKNGIAQEWVRTRPNGVFA